MNLSAQSEINSIPLSVTADHVHGLHFHHADDVALQPIRQFVAVIPDLVQTPGQTTKNILFYYFSYA